MAWCDEVWFVVVSKEEKQQKLYEEDENEKWYEGDENKKNED